MTAGVIVEALSDADDRRIFNCGVETLDSYFHERVTQDIKRGFATCFVAKSLDGTLLGFYTLASASFDIQMLPEQARKKLPRYPHVPAILMGRLAVDRSCAGQGIGRLLVADAAFRASRMEAGVYALLVDAKDERAAQFYASFGFMPFSGTPLSLFVPLKSVLDTIAALR